MPLDGNNRPELAIRLMLATRDATDRNGSSAIESRCRDASMRQKITPSETEDPVKSV
jgi:hypothetical protein